MTRAQPSIGILAGPTATGKTDVALRLAQRHPAIEIVNADSLQVYRRMDIGTAKSPSEERAGIPHHLLDIRDPDQTFTAGEFFREANAAIAEIEARGKRPLVVGGTGFYLKALLYGLWEAPPADPKIRERLSARSEAELYAALEERDREAALRIGARDRYRLVRALELIELTGRTPTELQADTPASPDPRFALWVIDRERDELDRRIAERARRMLEAGFLDEVRTIREHFPAARALNAVGYAQACAYLEGAPPAGRKLRPGIAGLQQELELATRQMAKSQRTFFRSQKTALWFVLDRDLPKLEVEMERVYGS